MNAYEKKSLLGVQPVLLEAGDVYGKEYTIYAITALEDSEILIDSCMLHESSINTGSNKSIELLQGQILYLDIIGVTVTTGSILGYIKEA